MYLLAFSILSIIFDDVNFWIRYAVGAFHLFMISLPSVFDKMIYCMNEKAVKLCLYYQLDL